MTLKWYGDQVLSKIDQAVVSGLTAAAIEVEAKAVKHCPIDTGNLVGSINYDVDPALFEATIGTNVEYAPYVEYGARGRAPKSFLRRSADELKPRINKIFNDEFKRFLKS
jgi:HK97 gp10 family phage protein